MNEATMILFIIFAAMVTISVVIQGCALAGMYFAARKTQKKVHSLLDDLRIHGLPALDASRDLVQNLSPKVKAVAYNVVETTGNVRGVSQEVSSVVREVAGRARVQAAHVDGIVQGTLEQITHAGDTFQHGISVPLRQLGGIASGFRAGWNVLWQKPPARNGRNGREYGAERVRVEDDFS